MGSGKGDAEMLGVHDYKVTKEFLDLQDQIKLTCSGFEFEMKTTQHRYAFNTRTIRAFGNLSTHEDHLEWVYSCGTRQQEWVR